MKYVLYRLREINDFDFDFDFEIILQSIKIKNPIKKVPTIALVPFKGTVRPDWI
jgi:hypothetical protein